MNNVFNGQINISRDLRQNKQTIFGKRDLLDIIFIVIGVSSAILVSYLLGFYLKIIDEFLAVFMGLMPMVLILILGFKRKAGIRYIFYLLMNKISKCRNNRTNKENINEVLSEEKKKSKKSILLREKRQISIKSILPLKILKKKTNDNVKSGKILDENNKSESIIIKVSNKNKKIFNKIILVFEANVDNVTELIKEYLSNEIVSRIQLRLKEDKCILLVELNYSYKEFLSLYIKNEYKTIGVQTNKKGKIKEFANRMKQKINYICKTKRKYYTKYSKFVNFEALSREFIPKILCDFYDDIKSKKLVFIPINDEYINSLNIKNKKVQMLHLYKNSEYIEIINEAKTKSEIVIYVIKKEEKIYISTYFVIDKEKEISLSKNVIINKLMREQGVAISQVLYHMYNPYNNYRFYKEME